MKKAFTGIRLGFLCASFQLFNTQLIAQSNYVSKDDPKLIRTEKCNNPMRVCYNFAATVGVDASKDAAAVYADLSSFFSLKGFLVRANYSFDLTKSNLINTTNPLVKQGQPYSNLQVSGFFNIKDNIKDVKMKPRVGMRELSREHVSQTMAKLTVNFFHTEEEIKIRKSFGLGGSLIMNKLNFAFTANDSTHKSEAVQFANTGANPKYLLLPYDVVIIGAGFQSSFFASYNIKYEYDGLRPYRFKENTFRIIQLEALLAPSINYAGNVLTRTNDGVNTELPLTKVKKFPMGIRVLIQQNIGKSGRGKKPGFFYNVEGGIRPGIYEKTFPNSLYVRFGVGLTI